MVTPQGDSEFAVAGMFSHCFRNCFCDTGNQARIFQNANRRVIGSIYVFKLVVPIKLNSPTKISDLFDEAGLNEVNCTLVNPRPWLRGCKWEVNVCRGAAHLSTTVCIADADMKVTSHLS